MTDQPDNEDLLSAHLDDELSADVRAQIDAALAADRDLARTHTELAEVRGMLRGGSVEMRAGALERMTAAIEAADADTGPHDRGRRGPGAPVVELAGRSRTPTAAAVAAVVLIIAGVVGGLGGSARIPALGDLVAQHEAAAAMVDGAAMPADMDHMDKMPMDDARAASLEMPADYEMADAFADGSTVHLIYRTGDGDSVSVIRQNGEADLAALGDGSMSSDGDVEMWSAPMGDAHVVVVDGTGYYWTVISDEPHDEMMGVMMHELPTRSPSMGDRLRDAAEAVVEPFRL